MPETAAAKKTKKTEASSPEGEFLHIWKIDDYYTIVARWPTRDVAEVEDWTIKRLAQLLADGELEVDSFTAFLEEIRTNRPTIIEPGENFQLIES